MTDSRQRFLFEKFPIRGELVQLSATLVEVFARHSYPDEIKRLMGQFMSASTLLSATIKFEGSLILQVKGEGQVSTLMTECRDQRYLRAIATYDTDADQEGPLLGKGQMAITIEPDKGERYQGIVPVSDTDLAGVLEHYFLQSEQLRTRLWLASSTTSAAGMLIQAMPTSASESSLNQESEDWQRITALSDTLTDNELLELPPQQLLHRLFHEESVRLFDPSTLEFQCQCSTERSGNALVAMGETETRTLLAENQGFIEIDCQFCRQHYRFDLDAVNQLFRSQLH